MEKTKISRRRFFRLGLYASAPYVLAFLDGYFIERRWITVRHIILSTNPTSRIAHFTDVHHKGDTAYFNKVVGMINKLQPDIVCFTGDLIEKAGYLEEAITCLRGIRFPLFGIPGNHDYWSGISFTDLEACCKETGGAWLLDREAVSPDGKLAVFGSTGQQGAPADSADWTKKRILLNHYPDAVDRLRLKFDLILAGHSHGGQIRLPFYGAITVPGRVGEYDMGLFRTPAGPLYVNPGIGYWALPLRIFCRPEITLIEI